MLHKKARRLLAGRPARCGRRFSCWLPSYSVWTWDRRSNAGRGGSLWNITPRLRRYGGICVRSCPSIAIFPFVGSCRPAIIIKIVVLPEPEGYGNPPWGQLVGKYFPVMKLTSGPPSISSRENIFPTIASVRFDAVKVNWTGASAAATTCVREHWAPPMMFFRLFRGAKASRERRACDRTLSKASHQDTGRWWPRSRLMNFNRFVTVA